MEVFCVSVFPLCLTYVFVLISLPVSASTSNGCADYYFKLRSNTHKQGGQLLRRNVSFLACKKLCSLDPTCLALDWDARGRYCYRHDKSTAGGPPITNKCCVHSVRVCTDQTAGTGNGRSATTTTTSTTTISPSTAGPFIKPNSIPDDEKCPSPFLKYTNSRQTGGGSLLPATNTAVQCKEACLQSANQPCVAAEFNRDTNECMLHSSVDASTFLRGTTPCCDHYRRTGCDEPIKCYSHMDQADIAKGETSEFENVILTPPASVNGLSLVDCPTGVCFYKQTTTAVASTGMPGFDSFVISVERGCVGQNEAVASLGKRCSDVTQMTSASAVDALCTCKGQRCNAFDFSAFESCLAYYSFDGDANDATQWRRNGVVDAVTFDLADAKKNWSAVFDGAGSVRVPRFSHLQLGGLLRTAQGYTLTNSLTVALWLKRTESQGDMTVLSNGDRVSASLQLRSDPMSGTFHRLYAGVRIAGNFYEVDAPALVDQWVFVVLRLSPAGVATEPRLELFLTSSSLQTGTPEDTIVVSDAPNEFIDFTSNPLTVGKQYQSPGSNTDSYYYTGLMDELWLFSRALTTKQLLAIRDTTEPVMTSLT